MNEQLHLQVETLTPSAFAPFGTVVEIPSREADAGGTGWNWWGETTLLEADTRPNGVGFLQLQPRPLSFDWAERHLRSEETLVPLIEDCLVYVGPPDHLDDPERLPALDQFHVFRIRQGQGAKLRKGVWHGVPLAIDKPATLMVLLLEGTGSSDNYLVRFTDRPVLID